MARLHATWLQSSAAEAAAEAAEEAAAVVEEEEAAVTTGEVEAELPEPAGAGGEGRTADDAAAEGRTAEAEEHAAMSGVAKALPELKAEAAGEVSAAEMDGTSADGETGGGAARPLDGAQDGAISPPTVETTRPA